MNLISSVLFEFENFTVTSIIFRILLATLCGAMIGYEPLVRGRAAGIRTHIMVCLGSAMTMLIGLYATDIIGEVTDPTRIAAQVVSGIGFLGMGTILVKGRNEVTGLTTAAGLWVTSIIGMAIGLGFYLGAVLATIISMLTVAVITKQEDKLIRRRGAREVYMEIDGVEALEEILLYLKEKKWIKQVDVTAPRSATTGNVGMEIIFRADKDHSRHEVIEKFRTIEHVVFVMEAI